MTAAGCATASAQRVAVKTNLISDAVFLSPNIGLETGVAPKWTIDLSGQLNLWEQHGGRRWKHWLAQPEVRYWFCQRFTGHFIGLELHCGQFNAGGIDLPFNILGTDFRRLKDHRYQGWQYGGGVTYGYDWIVAEHWNVEAEIGIGYSRARYDSYPCSTCGTRTGHDLGHNYFGITKAQLAIEYIF